MEKRAIIVQGAPGVGKTTLARRLAKDLSLPLISKDAIKESLYDTMGHPKDKTESELYGRIAIRAMYVGLDEYLKVGQKVIIEAPLLPQYVPADIAEVIDINQVLQLHVYCDPKIHAERFSLRSTSGERHPGHSDITIDAVVAQQRNTCIPGIETIAVDTTRFGELEYDELIEKIKQSM